MLPPLLKVAAAGSYGAKCSCIYCRRVFPCERSHIRVNVHALANARLHVLLHVLYASSVFSDNALFGFFHMSCFSYACGENSTDKAKSCSIWPVQDLITKAHTHELLIYNIWIQKKIQ